MQIAVGEKLNQPINLIVDLGIEPSKVAVLFSGGMDSTLVLYMLLEEKRLKNLNTEIHCFTAPQLGRKMHSEEILSLPEFSGKCIHHEDVKNETDEGIRPMLLELLHRGWTVYTGTNAVPDEPIGGRYPARKYKDPLPANLFNPFRYAFKHHILEAYSKLNIEHLISKTHSCTEQEIGECGICFACYERAWAFKKLGLKSTNEQ